MAACLLRAIQMKLPTKDKLHQWGILQNNTCVLCKLYPEAISRLFFDCRYTSYIWALCKLKWGLSQQISSLTIEAIMLNSTFRTKSQSTTLARLVLAAAVWHIWKERNLRIFQHKETKNTQRFLQLQRDVLTLLQESKWGEDSDKAKAEMLQN